MRIWKFLPAMCALAATGLVGCGGAGNSIDGTRGEGNIPIGRLAAAPGSVTLMLTNRYGDTINGSVDTAGVMWAPMTAVGPATVSIQPADANLDPVAFNIEFGLRQAYVIDAALNELKPEAVVTGLAIELPNGKDPQVGKTSPVKVVISGTGATGLKATVWVEGDVGFMDDNHRFVGSAAGPGVIKATLRGVTASLPINVTP